MTHPREEFENQMRRQFGEHVYLVRVSEENRHAGQEVGDYEADTIQSCWLAYQAALSADRASSISARR